EASTPVPVNGSVTSPFPSKRNEFHFSPCSQRALPVFTRIHMPTHTHTHIHTHTHTLHMLLLIIPVHSPVVYSLTPAVKAKGWVSALLLLALERSLAGVCVCVGGRG